MQRNHLGDIQTFIEVVKHGGFRAAAANLNRSPASVSEAVQRLEDGLKARLLERSTRSMSLTEIGQSFYDRSLPAVTDLEDAVRDIDDQRDIISGTLRLSAPYSAGPFFLDSLVAEFSSKYPDVKTALIYDDNKVDLLTSGIDAAIRANTLLEPSTHAVSVGPELNMSIVASPKYLAKYPKITSPEDILDHDTLCYVFGRSGAQAPWGFMRGKDKFVMEPSPKIVANDMRSLSYFARQHMGLTYIYSELAQAFIDRGELISVLDEFLPPLPRYSLNYSSKRNMPPRLRAFIDLAKSRQKQGSISP